MYAHIRGIAEEVDTDRAVIEAQGVGYELLCSSATLRQCKKGQPIKLYTHFHLGQDIMALYGFYTSEERAMFRRLIGVTRVGPKLALAVLSHLSVSEVAAAIFTENADALARVPGMGKKTAARVLLELKEKIGSDEMIAAHVPESIVSGNASMRGEAIAALVALGYDGLSAGRAVSAVVECERVEDMITLALREMVKGSKA